MNRLIIVGSPRIDGRSAMLGDELFNACIEDYPEDGISIASVSSLDIAPCDGCGACAVRLEKRFPLPESEMGAEAGESGPDPLLEPCEAVAKSAAGFHRCAIRDEMDELRVLLDASDELYLIVPVYFAGLPSQMKALADRLQPYFFTKLRFGELRPIIVHIVGDGHDPYGFDGALATIASSFGCAGFGIAEVLNWVGKISPAPDCEILEEAEEYPVPRFGTIAVASGKDDGDGKAVEGGKPRGSGKAAEAAKAADFEKPGSKKQGRK